MAWNEPGGSNNNGKDPWGGGNGGGGRKGPEQGPPDLDEALQKFMEKLGLGKKSTGGGSGGPSLPSSASPKLLLVVLAVVLLGWFLSGWYTLDEKERGVVLRLGKYSETVGPGLQWNPPLIDEVRTVNVTEVRTRNNRALMLTKDENIVDIEMAVQYVIEDPRLFELNVRDPEGSLSHASESALRHVVGSTDMHSILTQGREALSVQVQTRIQDYMRNYGTGLQISKVNIKQATAPSQVQDAFNDVIRAREDEVRVKNEAESYANGIVPEARGQAQRMIEEANAYREEVIARAEGESKRFIALLDEYEKAPEVTRERLYLSTMEEVLSQSPKVLMDVEGGNNMMYLPLDKLSEMTVQQKATSPASTSYMKLDDDSVKLVADQVLEQLRQRQAATTRREGR